MQLANRFVGYRVFAPVLIGIAAMLISFRPADVTAPSLVGGWEHKAGSQRMARIFTEKYFTIAVYGQADGEFISTAGGTWRIEGTNLVQTYEYHTANPELKTNDSLSRLATKNFRSNPAAKRKCGTGWMMVLRDSWLEPG